MKNKRIVVTHHGGPEVLQLIEEEVPEPAPDQVRLRVLAAGVAYADVSVRLGTYRIPEPHPDKVSPGYDVVGVVDKVGAQVSNWRVGERVAALTVVGGYTDYLCWPASDLVAVPEGADSAEAVSLVLNYITAYQMLHRVANVQPGQYILVHGGGGGVGTALLQLGKLAQLRLIATASAKKQALLSELGAVAINYQSEDFVSRVREITVDGVDSVYDPIGGENIARSFDALCNGGILVTYGNYVANQGGQVHPERATLTGQIRESLQQRIDSNQADTKRLAGYFIGALKAQQPEWFYTDLEILMNMLAKGDIRPLIAERLPLAQAQRAHELIDNAAIIGKIVLVPNS